MADKRGVLGIVLGTLISLALALGILLGLRIWVPVVSISVIGIGGLIAVGAGFFMAVMGLLHFFGFFYYFMREKDYGDSSKEYRLGQVEGREEYEE